MCNISAPLEPDSECESLSPDGLEHGNPAPDRRSHLIPLPPFEMQRERAHERTASRGAVRLGDAYHIFVVALKHFMVAVTWTTKTIGCIRKREHKNQTLAPQSR